MISGLSTGMMKGQEDVWVSPEVRRKNAILEGMEWISRGAVHQGIFIPLNGLSVRCPKWQEARESRSSGIDMEVVPREGLEVVKQAPSAPLSTFASLITGGKEGMS